jgi:dihydroorotate dehydrogenase electron transfer subunit
MLKKLLKIISNTEIAPETYELILEGNPGIRRPGQFMEIALKGFFLRRPLSVCHWTEDSTTLIYKAVGSGTSYLASHKPGTTLEVLSPLGNGFDTSKSGATPALIGGGAGVPPIYGLAKTLISEGKTPVAVLGWNTAREAFYVDKFIKLGVPVAVTTADGSLGTRGFVTDALPENYSYFFSCGPEPMLKAVCAATKTSGQLSFEARMGCGFGACMGCSCKTLTGVKRICKDGPVLEKEEIIWPISR